ncbi:hypothetical protein MUE08_004647 [Vibrio parahaemolyticus]|nr:hypothetical protein [Vibrio parahaemolyticus]EIA1585961.1 hypothetical protein [Vibrio parahaemolyticus]EJB1774732.1 hypothetical protein [Vibrio parahaemolyticus]
MLSELNNRLAIVAENIAEIEGQFGEYFRPERCICTVNGQEVFLEYQHDLTFEQASEQAEALLRFFKVPIGDNVRDLLVEISGKGTITKVHLDLSYTDEDDLLLQYICSELLLFFQKVACKP